MKRKLFAKKTPHAFFRGAGEKNYRYSFFILKTFHSGNEIFKYSSVKLNEPVEKLLQP